MKRLNDNEWAELVEIGDLIAPRWTDTFLIDQNRILWESLWEWMNEQELD